jgi:hypothetical protein
MDWVGLRGRVDAQAAEEARNALQANQQALDAQRFEFGARMEQMRFGLEAQKNNVEAQAAANQMTIQSKRLEMESEAHKLDATVQNAQLDVARQDLALKAQAAKEHMDDMAAANTDKAAVQTFSLSPKAKSLQTNAAMTKTGAEGRNLSMFLIGHDAYSREFGPEAVDANGKITFLQDKKGMSGLPSRFATPEEVGSIPKDWSYIPLDQYGEPRVTVIKASVDANGVPVPTQNIPTRWTPHDIRQALVSGSVEDRKEAARLITANTAPAMKDSVVDYILKNVRPEDYGKLNIGQYDERLNVVNGAVIKQLSEDIANRYSIQDVNRRAVINNSLIVIDKKAKTSIPARQAFMENLRSSETPATVAAVEAAFKAMDTKVVVEPPASKPIPTGDPALSDSVLGTPEVIGEDGNPLILDLKDGRKIYVQKSMLKTLGLMIGSGTRETLSDIKGAAKGTVMPVVRGVRSAGSGIAEGFSGNAE